MTCKQCGDCCRNNGLMPPWLDADDTEPKWLGILVKATRGHYDDNGDWMSEAWDVENLRDWPGEDSPCIFLTTDNRCAIYNDRPKVCREFDCNQTKGDYEAGRLLSEKAVEGVIKQLRKENKELQKAMPDPNETFYKAVEPKEGQPCQYLGVYILNWQQEWGEPEIGFIEAGEAAETAKEKSNAT